MEETIEARQKAIDITPDGHINKVLCLNNLGNTYEAKFNRLGDPSDLREAIRAVSTAAQSLIGSPHIKIVAAGQWCRLSGLTNDKQETLRAYGCAISLIPQVAWMGLAVEGRHWQLERLSELVRNAAAAAVKFGEYDTALEWLEQGRSVVWGQALHLRSPLDALRERDHRIADRLSAISRALNADFQDQELGTSAKRDRLRTLSFEWDRLVSEVRRMDGFEDFMGPKKFAQLFQATSSGMVVVLNAHANGCDALVLRAEAGGVIHIPLSMTTQTTQDLLISLDNIQSYHPPARGVEPIDRGFKVIGGVSYDANRMIQSLLAELWAGIVKPVIDGLGLEVDNFI